MSRAGDVRPSPAAVGRGTGDRHGRHTREAPPEFVPQTDRGGDYAVGVARFAVGEETVDVPLQVCDANPATVEAGDTVRVVFRLVDRLDGLPRYGAKVRPV